MGGAAAGEVASRIAVDTIVDRLRADHAATRPAPDHNGYLPQTSKLGAVIEQANDAVFAYAQGDREREGMGTTVVCLRTGPTVASVAHVGDSRAYYWHEGTFEPLTTDHSVVEAQVRAGLISREQSLKSEHQNVLLQALGMGEGVNVDLAEVPVQAGDFLLLCTDGLTRTVSEEEMAAAIASLRDPEKICRQLIDRANENGGPDNVTVVVVEILPSFWGRLLNRLRRW